MTRWVIGLSLLAATCAAAQEPGELAIDTVALRHVTAIYRRQPDSVLVCMAGHFQGPVPVLDSVIALKVDCPRRTFAILGLSYGSPPPDVVHRLSRILDMREDVALAGVIHGIVPIVLPSGKQAFAPVIIAVWRTPVERSPSRPGDGP